MRDRDNLDAEIEADMTGPKPGDVQIAADDTDMKNPDNEFADPGSAASIGRAVKKPERKDGEVEGRQGSTRPESLGRNA